MNRLLHIAHSKGEEPYMCRTSILGLVLSEYNKLVESLWMHGLFAVFDGKNGYLYIPRGNWQAFLILCVL